MTEPADRRKCSWLCLGVVLAGLAGFAGTARIISVAYEKVMSGQGLDTYRTVWLVEFNYIGVLVLFAVALVAILIGGALWLHEWWQWRSLERKYGNRQGNT